MSVWEFDAIGTHWSIEICNEENAPIPLAESVRSLVSAHIETFDKNYSRFRSDSLISEMARTAGTYELPSDAKPLFDLYYELYQVTHGAFTPLIGQTLVDAGYDAQYSLEQKGELESPPAWQEVLSYEYPKLIIKTPVLLDVGAAGKGYLVDTISELLQRAGIHSFFINAGGDIRYENPEGVPVQIALEHPNDATLAIGVASIVSGSICGSAGNRRVWKTAGTSYHHVLDPRSRVSPMHIKAVWVTAPTALVADALTTCLFFLSPLELSTALQGSHAFEYLLVDADGACAKSPGFPAEIFTA